MSIYQSCSEGSVLLLTPSGEGSTELEKLITAYNAETGKNVTLALGGKVKIEVQSRDSLIKAGETYTRASESVAFFSAFVFEGTEQIALEFMRVTDNNEQVALMAAEGHSGVSQAPVSTISTKAKKGKSSFAFSAAIEDESLKFNFKQSADVCSLEKLTMGTEVDGEPELEKQYGVLVAYGSGLSDTSKKYDYSACGYSYKASVASSVLAFSLQSSKTLSYNGETIDLGKILNTAGLDRAYPTFKMEKLK